MGFWSTQFSSGNQPYMPLNPTSWEHILRVEDEYPEPRKVYLSISEQIAQDIDREVLGVAFGMGCRVAHNSCYSCESYADHPSADCPTSWYWIENGVAF